MCRSTEYIAWLNMKVRCYKKSYHHYKDYGGRGIKVHEDWINDFISFYEYIGKKPKGYTLDRIDVNKDYEPGNVRWASWKTQVANRRPVGMIPFRGVTPVKGKSYYRCVLSCKQDRVNIGYFETIEEAAYMYDCFVISIYGDEFPTNFDYEPIGAPKIICPSVVG